MKLVMNQLRCKQRNILGLSEDAASAALLEAFAQMSSADQECILGYALDIAGEEVRCRVVTPTQRRQRRALSLA